MTNTVRQRGPITDPLTMTAAYVDAFNSGDADDVLALYAEDAVSMWEEGSPVTGRAHEDIVRRYLALHPTMHATVRESHVAGDTALLVVDWTIDVPEGPHGAAERLAGIGADVLRRGPDGAWRYVIDNPYSAV